MKFRVEIADKRQPSRAVSFIEIDATLAESVRSLKQKIAATLEKIAAQVAAKHKRVVPPSRQCLVFAGRQLEDNRTLAELVAQVTVERKCLVRVHSSESPYNSRGGVCVKFNTQTNEWTVHLDSHNEMPKCQAVFAPDNLQVLAGSPRNPFFLFEDFEVVENPHDVKVMISPTQLQKYGHHDLAGADSVRGPKTRVFSLQVECGTYTLWYSKTPQEAAPFFFEPKPSHAKELHHSMPLLGVVDLHGASMYASDAPDSRECVLTIILDVVHHLNVELSDKHPYCLKIWDALRMVFDSVERRSFWITKLQSCNVLLGIYCLMQPYFCSFTSQMLSGTGSGDSCVEKARAIETLIGQAFEKLEKNVDLRLRPVPDGEQVRQNNLEALTLLNEAHVLYEKERNQKAPRADPDGPPSLVDESHVAGLGISIDCLRPQSSAATAPSHTPAVLQKYNIAAFCIAALFSAEPLLFPTITSPSDASVDPNIITAEQASKLYEQAVPNARESLKGTSRDPALEDRDASVLQQFCAAQEIGTPEYASLLSHTLICLSVYLHQRTDKAKALHPHYDGVPHRHSQLFNRAWCRLAELKFEAPVLRFALLQVALFLDKHRRVVAFLNDCEYANRKAKKIARPEFKKMMSDRMLFLGRYRIDQQELTNSSNSRIVVDAIEAVTQDGEAGHQKVALHFLECKEDLDLERAVREAIVSHHKNSEIVSQKEAQPFMACPPSVPRSVTVEESVAVNDGGAEHKNVDFQSSSKGLMKGKLMKNARTGSFQGQNWTKRHFELAGLKLDYAEKPGEQLKKKSIELAEGHSCVPLDKDGSASRKKYSFRFNILDSKKVLVAELAAKTLDDRIRWVEAIRRACQPAAASAAPSAPGQPLVISGESPAAAPLPHIGELTDASVDVSLPPRKNAAAAVEVDCRASVSVVHPVNVVRGEEVHFLQLHPPSSKWKKRQIILEEDKIVYTDTSLYKAKRILVKLSPFTAVDVQEETYNPPSPWTFTLKIDGELENGYRSEVVLAFNNENVRVLWKDYLKHVISRLKAASDIVDEYSNAQNVSETLPQRRQICDDVPGRGEKVDFLQQSTLHSRPRWKKRRVFVEKDKILYTDESLLKVKRPLLQLTGQSKVGVPMNLRETTFAPQPFMLQIEGEMDRQPFIVLLALIDERSFEAWKSLLLQAIDGIDDKSGFQNCDHRLGDTAEGRVCQNVKCPLRASEKTAVQHVRLVPYLLCNEQPLAPLELESALSQFRLQIFLKYQHLLVMPFCRRNLADIIDKEWVTLDSNQFLDKKQLIVALIKSVKYMHDAGYVHGDLKPRHFVRYNDDYALINLHASAKIGCPASWRKASTAYLPPEAIRYLDAHPMVTGAGVAEDHAAVCRCGDTFASVPEVESVTVVNSKATLKFRSKHPFSQGQDVRLSGFKPETTSGGVIINDSFHISDCTEHSIEFSICDVAFGSVGVYDCQAVGGVAFNCLGLCGLAHSAHDMWALGVMIFRLVTRKPLFHESGDDNVTRGDKHWNNLKQWTQEIKKKRLMDAIETQEMNMKQLLSMLLEKQPWKRPKRVGDLFFLPYFETEIFARQMEEIDLLLLKNHKTQFGTGVQEAKFSTPLTLSNYKKTVTPLRRNMCIPEQQRLDLSLDGIELEVSALADCPDCADSQALALENMRASGVQVQHPAASAARESQLGNTRLSEHAACTRYLAKKLKKLKEYKTSCLKICLGDAAKPVPPHCEHIDAIEALRVEIQRLRVVMEQGGFWYYGCNKPGQTRVLEAPKWTPESCKSQLSQFSEEFKQPMCDLCQKYYLDWTSISADMHYVLHERSEEKATEKGVRDKGHAGRTLQDFMACDEVKTSELKIAELACMRFYTSQSFRSIIQHLRDVDESGNRPQQMPHPLPSIVENIVNGLKQLRQKDSESGTDTKILWRGLSDRMLPADFKYGTENALMSTSSHLKTAMWYGLQEGKPDNILFRIVTTNNSQRGADIQWLSMFPAEGEVLYPPFTFLQVDPSVPPKHIKHGTTSFRIVTVSSTLP